MFLSLAECWRLVSFPYYSRKDLRVLDGVSAELFSCEKSTLVHLTQHLHNCVCCEVILGPRSIVIEPCESLTYNNERLLLTEGF